MCELESVKVRERERDIDRLIEKRRQKEEIRHFKIVGSPSISVLESDRPVGENGRRRP